MNHKVFLPIPVNAAMRKLGNDINLARRRRRITMCILAERAGISRSTLSRIEKGDSSASIGAYANVLFALGMIKAFEGLVDAQLDVLGRELQDETLPKRVRLKETMF